MKPIHFVAFVLFIWPYAAFAQTSQPAISLTTDVEDGKKMVHAVVVLNGKPIENTTLQYFVQRTFGNLQIGEDTTLDDGTSAVAFPSDLPGASDGNLPIQFSGSHVDGSERSQTGPESSAELKGTKS